MCGVLGCVGCWDVWGVGMCGVLGCVGCWDVWGVGMCGVLGCVEWDRSICYMIDADTVFVFNIFFT